MMKKCLGLAEEYIKGMSIWDMAFLKICLYTAGLLMGMAVPKKHGREVAFVATGTFVVTYLMVMLPFLKLIEEKNK